MTVPADKERRVNRVLVCGSRSATNRCGILQRLIKLPKDTEIIHGNARGADRIAAELAEELGLRVRAFPTDWLRHGRRAGLVRNAQMLDEKPGLVIAFWDGYSRGTQHTINEALRRGIPTEVWEP